MEVPVAVPMNAEMMKRPAQRNWNRDQGKAEVDGRVTSAHGSCDTCESTGEDVDDQHGQDIQVGTLAKVANFSSMVPLLRAKATMTAMNIAVTVGN